MTVMNTDSDARHAAALPLDFEVMQIVCPINCNLYPKLRHASLLQINHCNHRPHIVTLLHPIYMQINWLHESCKSELIDRLNLFVLFLLLFNVCVRQIINYLYYIIRQAFIHVCTVSCGIPEHMDMYGCMIV